MNGVTNLPKVIEALEADPLLLEILGDVLLYDPGSPDVPFSQPLIPKSLILQRLVDYLFYTGCWIIMDSFTIFTWALTE